MDFQTTQATGTAERNIVPELLDQARERGFHPQTLGGDKGYDTRDFVADLRRRGVTLARRAEQQGAFQRH